MLNLFWLTAAIFCAIGIAALWPNFDNLD